MCADLLLQAEAATLVGWLACSSNENACSIGSFDSFISYIAILMGSTSARVQKQASLLAPTPSRSTQPNLFGRLAGLCVRFVSVATAQRSPVCKCMLAARNSLKFLPHHIPVMIGLRVLFLQPLVAMIPQRSYMLAG